MDRLMKMLLGAVVPLYMMVVAASASETQWIKSQDLCYAGPPTCSPTDNSNGAATDCLTHHLAPCPGVSLQPQPPGTDSIKLTSHIVGTFVASADEKYITTEECTWANLSNMTYTTEAILESCSAVAKKGGRRVFQDESPANASLRSLMFGTTAGPVNASVYVGLKTVINTGESKEQVKQSPYTFADYTHNSASATDERAPMSHLICPDMSNTGPYPRTGNDCAPGTTVAKGGGMQTLFAYFSGPGISNAMADDRALNLTLSGFRIAYAIRGSPNKVLINGRDWGAIIVAGEKFESIDITTISIQQKDGYGMLLTFPPLFYYGKLASADGDTTFESLGVSTDVKVRMKDQTNADGLSFDLDVLISNAHLGGANTYVTYTPTVTSLAPNITAPVECPTLAPAECPTCAAVQACPTLAPAECPTCAAVQACPTLAPAECPTCAAVQECPTLAAAQCPTIKAKECDCTNAASHMVVPAGIASTVFLLAITSAGLC